MMKRHHVQLDHCIHRRPSLRRGSRCGLRGNTKFFGPVEIAGEQPCWKKIELKAKALTVFGIGELRKLYWWWGSDTADFFFDKFVPDGLSLENLEDEKKNAIGTMLTAVREDIGQLPRTVKAQQRDMNRLAVSVADAAFNARLAERRHYVVLARPVGRTVAAFCRSAVRRSPGLTRQLPTMLNHHVPDTQNRPKNRPGSTTSSTP
jgi:hypothetical protein